MRLILLGFFAALMGCSSGEETAGSSSQWDGKAKNETDAIVTLRLPGEPGSILLNGEQATTSADRGQGTVKVLIPSDESGISCENTFIVSFKDGSKGQLLANHCQGDDTFEVKPGEILDKRVTKEDIDNPRDDAPVEAQQGGEGFAPGASLAFEWSANGFEQLPSQYKWMGSGKRDEYFEPNFSLTVPETDDVIWSSSCSGNGQVMSRVYLNLPDQKAGDKAAFRFETDKSTSTLRYTANFVGEDEFAGFQIVQSANDPMFAEMKSGTWAYLQMGDGDDAAKVRIALTGSKTALDAFLPACR